MYRAVFIRGKGPRDCNQYAEGIARSVEAREAQPPLPLTLVVGTSNPAIVDELPELVVERGEARPTERGERKPYDGRSDRARAVIVADCQRIAEVAEPDDSLVRIAAKLGLSDDVVWRRVRAMERELGLPPADKSEAAQHRRAGAIAKRWRRHAL